MAITYHAGRRIQGTSTEVLDTVTFSDDFSSDNWTDVGSNGVTGGHLQLNPFLNNSDNTTYRAITALSDTAFVMRFSFTPVYTGHSSGNSSQIVWFGLASGTGNSATTQNWVILGIEGWSSANRKLGAYALNGTAVSQFPSGNNFMSFTSGTTYYCQITRDGDDFTFNIYDDSEYSSQVGTVTRTVSSFYGLDTLIGTNWVASGSNNATATNEIDDVKIYDGVTSLTSKPTNVQVGSRFEETDTRKMYHYESGSPTDLDTVTWTNSPTGSTWGQSNNEITFANMTGSTEVMYYDVGTANISDTKWVLRFKLDIDTWIQGTSASSDWVMFGLSSTAGNSDTSQDSMVGVIRNNSSSQSLAITRTNGTTINSQLGSTDLEVLGATGSFYVEMIRTSDANYTLNVRSGSHSGTLLGSQDYTNASGVGGLRYIKAMNHLTSNTNADASGSFGEIEFYNGVVTAVLPSEWKEEGT